MFMINRIKKAMYRSISQSLHLSLIIFSNILNEICLMKVKIKTKKVDLKKKNKVRVGWRARVTMVVKLRAK